MNPGRMCDQNQALISDHSYDPHTIYSNNYIFPNPEKHILIRRMHFRYYPENNIPQAICHRSIYLILNSNLQCSYRYRISFRNYNTPQHPKHNIAGSLVRKHNNVYQFHRFLLYLDQNNIEIQRLHHSTNHRFEHCSILFSNYCYYVDFCSLILYNKQLTKRWQRICLWVPNKNICYYQWY